jgi:hypothetical protein
LCDNEKKRVTPGSILETLGAKSKPRERAAGMRGTDLLELPTAWRGAVRVIMRRGEMTLTELASELELGPSEAKRLVDEMVAKGHLRVVEAEGEVRYTAVLARTQGRELPPKIWEVLKDK